MPSQSRNMTEETAVASSSGSMDEKPGSSSTMAADSSVDVMAEAKKLIGAGNRHLVMGDVVSAVHVFQEACGMLAARYGDTADECGEAFFLCGKSLLELARVENTVLGNALEGVPEESSEEEGEGEKLDNSKIESADNLEDDDDDEGEGTGEDKEEEVGNLQLAWEMLEVAKVIYKRKENKEDQLMAAQAYLKLGEVGAESGNYSAAVEDFQDCLSLQLKHLPPHSRLVAETHYQLGMTYCITGQYSQAIQHYSSSVKVIESRLAMLQEVIDKAEGEDGAKEKIELEDLKQLLPEVAEKVEDAKESQSMAGSASVAIQQTLAGASTLSAFPSSSSSAFAENGGPSSSCSSAFGTSQISVRSAADGASPSKSASDISHLVRKKRKTTEKSPVKDTDAKKTKQETTVNGSGDSGSGSNGVQEKGAQEPGKLSASVESSV
ncbi:nuclear autoantigenic sperm protein-like isoform X4 [Oncorhynchus keta]|uniref:nuclear autoantigenic sperm protein-like isoform X4 n=1 Tax=Oncorhynchus keta TaxID=8018 RepID=UPI0015FA28D9|nr:nuclear autoantigenic sperm protein-like isoform X4 [Oncorhynchus keta]